MVDRPPVTLEDFPDKFCRLCGSKALKGWHYFDYDEDSGKQRRACHYRCPLFYTWWQRFFNLSEHDEWFMSEAYLSRPPPPKAHNAISPK